MRLTGFLLCKSTFFIFTMLFVMAIITEHNIYWVFHIISTKYIVFTYFFFINNSMRHRQPHLLYYVEPDLIGLISVNLNDWNITIKFTIELEEGGYCCVRGS